MTPQVEMAAHAPILAIVAGKPFTETPSDLFIPPDALAILLDSFTGPLDLLLYLIRRDNIDILAIPIVKITEQYMQYIHLMDVQRLELAADYLLMAAVLAEIKSRVLLPPLKKPDDELEEDPRLTLVRKLQAYEQFKQAAANLDELPRFERDIFRTQMQVGGLQTVVTHPEICLSALIEAMSALTTRQDQCTHHLITKEPLSVSLRITAILARLQQQKSLWFTELLLQREGRMGLAVTLLALLELARQSVITMTQPKAYEAIRIQVAHDE